MSIAYPLLAAINHGLHYLAYVVNFFVAVPIFTVAGRLKVNAPAASKMFTLAAVVLLVRASIEPFLFVFNYLSRYMASQAIDIFMFETVRFYLPDILVFAAALILSNGVQKLIAPPQPMNMPNMMRR